MITVAIIGSGLAGATWPSRRFAHGYDVVMSNSPEPETLVGRVAELRPKVGAATSQPIEEHAR